MLSIYFKTVAIFTVQKKVIMPRRCKYRYAIKLGCCFGNHLEITVLKIHLMRLYVHILGSFYC